MSKPSRRRQGRPGSTPTGATPRPPATPPATGSTTSASSTGETVPQTSTAARSIGGHDVQRAGTHRPSTGPTGTARTGRRTRSTYQQRSFAERHRGTIIGIAAIAGVALIGIFFVYSASRPLFQCTNIWEPTPTASPSARRQPGARLRPGRHGPAARPARRGRQLHVLPAGVGQPLLRGRPRPDPARAFYGVNDKTIPQGWVHNLEHGALVLLYRGDSEGATPGGPAGAPGVLRRRSRPARSATSPRARARAR